MNLNFLFAMMLAGTMLFAFPYAFADAGLEVYKFANNGQEFKILYNTTNVNVSRITVDQASFSLTIYLSELKENAKLDITIPRELVAGIPLSEDLFVLLDGKEIESFEESASSQCFRTLSIHLPPKHSNGENMLEIIGFKPSMMPTVEKIPPIHIVTEWNEQSKEMTISGCTSLALNDEEVAINISDQKGVIYKTLSATPDQSGSFLITVPSINEQLANGTYIASAEYDDQHANSVLVIPEFPLVIITILGISTSFLLILKRVNVFSKI